MNSSLSIHQALGIWTELAQAYYGKNGFGGDTAEIYAYRLCRNSPAAYSNAGMISAAARADNAVEAAENLFQIVQEFEKQWGCWCYIDNLRPKKWRKIIGEKFIHRVRVGVLHEQP